MAASAPRSNASCSISTRGPVAPRRCLKTCRPRCVVRWSQSCLPGPAAVSRSTGSDCAPPAMHRNSPFQRVLEKASLQLTSISTGELHMASHQRWRKDDERRRDGERRRGGEYGRYGHERPENESEWERRRGGQYGSDYGRHGEDHVSSEDEGE